MIRRRLVTAQTAVGDHLPDGAGGHAEVFGGLVEFGVAAAGSAVRALRGPRAGIAKFSCHWGSSASKVMPSTRGSETGSAIRAIGSTTR